MYDAIGRLTKTTKPDGNTTSTLYDDPDLRVLTFDENGVSKEYFYDFVGRLIWLGEHSIDNVNYAVTNYYYDQVGNLLKIIDALSRTTIYNYDNLNRLTLANYPDYTTETYTYDLGSNIIVKTDRKNIKTLLLRFSQPSEYDHLLRLPSHQHELYLRQERQLGPAAKPERYCLLRVRWA